MDGTIPASHVIGNEIDLPDERGVFSASNSIGAYQTQGFVVTANSGDSPQSTTISTAFANPLGVTVTANDPGVPVDNGVITFTAPASGASAVTWRQPGHHQRWNRERQCHGQWHGRKLCRERLGGLWH